MTPQLSPEVTEKVLAILRENLHGEKFTLDHPRRTLEEFFLDVIAKAKQESVETSGALGGAIASYLSARSDKESAVLQSLIAEPEPVKPKAPREDAVALAARLRREEEARLADLTQAAAPVQPDRDEEARRAEAEALKEADEKLSDLLKNR